jgi:hypothetical protein
MAKAGIKFLYANGGPESITRIDCLSSNPSLKGTIVLTPFVNLTSFQGGDNDLEAVIGFSALTALKSFEIAGKNTVSFNISSLPINLENLNIRCCGSLSGNIGILPNSLVRYEVWGKNFTTGDINNLPNNLETFVNRGDPGANTTSGNIGNLPSSLTYYDNRGNNTTSGDIGNLPSGLVYFLNTGTNTTSGNIESLKTNTPNLTSFANYGSNTTTGNISGLPNSLVIYDNRGSNTTFGNISSLPATLTIYINRGSNTVFGNINDLPSNIVQFDNQGFNTVTGNITAVKSNLTSYINSGSNTISATTLSLKTNYPNLVTYIDTGFGNISGDFKDLPIALETLEARAYNTMQGHFSALPVNLKTFYNRRTTATPNVTCDVSKMPPSLELLDMRGGGFRVFGDIKEFPNTLKNFTVGFGSPKAPAGVNGVNATIQVSGNVVDLPRSMTVFACDSSLPYICKFRELPRGLTSLIMRGQWKGEDEDELNQGFESTNHYFEGDLKEIPRGCTTTIALGSFDKDFISGNIKDLPKNVRYVSMGGLNSTITGNLKDIPSDRMTVFVIFGKNTISGNLSGVPKTMEALDIRGNNTITGNLTSLSAENITYLTLINTEGCQVYDYYDGTEGNYQGIKWGKNRGGMLRTLIRPALKNDLAGMPQEHLVTLLVDLCGSDWAPSNFRYCTFNVNQPAIFYSLYPEASAAVKSISDRNIPVTINAISAVPTFYRDFAKYKTLNHGGALSGASITFTRNSSATYFDNNGILQVVGPNVPRFDHDPLTGVSKGLLIEETNINYLTASEQFNSWTKDWVTVDSNVIVAPNGQQVADKIVAEPVYSNHRLIQNTTQMPPASSVVTFSVYAKAGENNTLRLSVRDAGDTTKSFYADFDLKLEQYFSNNTGVGSSVRNAYIQKIKNDWYRCVVNGIPNATSLNRCDCTIAISNLSAIDTDVENLEYRPKNENEGLYIWGAQLERVHPEVQPSTVIRDGYIFASSYIPTTITIGTKIQDYAVVLSTTSFININVGTYLAKAYSPLPGYGVPLSAGELYPGTPPGQLASHRRIFKVNDESFTYTSGYGTFGRAGETYLRGFGAAPNNNIFKEKNKYLAKICMSYQTGQLVRSSANGKLPESTNVSLSTYAPFGIGAQTVMTIGSDLSGSVGDPGELNWRSRYLNGHVSSLMYIPEFLPQSQVTAMSI